MGFHTFEARKKVDTHEFVQLYNNLLEYSKENGIRFYREKNEESLLNSNIASNKNRKFIKKVISQNIWISDALKHKGIIIKLVQFICDDYKRNSSFWYNGIWYRINPRRVLNDQEYIGIFNSKDVEKMLDCANELIKDVCKKLPSLDECILGRLDFCQNVDLKDQRLVETYVDLVKRCNITPGFKMIKFYDETQRKELYSKDGIKLSKGCMSITVYNKKAQMEKQNYFYPDINAATGILRFEIQAYYRKIYDLRKKKGIKTIRDFLKYGEKIAANQFNYYLPKIFYKGDYYPYEVAKDRILNSKNTENTKKRMLDLLHKSSIHKSLFKAIHEMETSGYLKAQIRTLIEKFNELDLNPTTIPRRWNEDGGLLNPLKLVNVGFSKEIFDQINEEERRRKKSYVIKINI